MSDGGITCDCFAASALLYYCDLTGQQQLVGRPAVDSSVPSGKPCLQAAMHEYAVTGLLNNG
jgi:hypothetical protein